MGSFREQLHAKDSITWYIVKISIKYSLGLLLLFVCCESIRLLTAAGSGGVVFVMAQLLAG